VPSSSIVAGPPPLRLLRQRWRSSLAPEAARRALVPLAPGDGARVCFGGRAARAQLELFPEGSGTRIDATFGFSLGFAICQWVGACYALFFLGMAIFARAGQPFTPALPLVLAAPPVAIAALGAMATAVRSNLRARVERSLLEGLKAERA